MPVTGATVFTATHYGVSYQGSPLGCGGGVYDTDDPSIVAVGPAYYRLWPCGTTLVVCGTGGCIAGRRVDSCPGCVGRWVDLSEAGILAVCGFYGRCEVTVEVK